MSHPRIPTILQPFIQVPSEHSLHVISHVLGASANWLIIRYLCAILGNGNHGRQHDASVVDYLDGSMATNNTLNDEGNLVAVVLVSWMREWEFWQTETRRAGGLNLDLLQQKGLFTFVNGLSSLFVPVHTTQRPSRVQVQERLSTPPVSKVTLVTQDAPAVFDPPNNASHASSARTPTLDTIKSTILNSISALRQAKPDARIVLILDSPTLLLQTLPTVTSHALHQFLLSLRSVVHSTIVACPADTSFIQPAASTADHVLDGVLQTGVPSPLARETAAFIMGEVHQAHSVLSCRRLGTGWAEDVSGVIRATRGGASDDAADGEHEGEWLYHISGDGGVRVWRRGER